MSVGFTCQMIAGSRGLNFNLNDDKSNKIKFISP